MLADTSHRDLTGMLFPLEKIYITEISALAFHQSLDFVLTAPALLALAGAYLTVDFGLFCGQMCY